MTSENDIRATILWRMMMKLVLIIYIGLLTLLGYIAQIGLPTAALTLAFIVLNIICVPIIMVFLLKFYFTFSARSRFH